MDGEQKKERKTQKLAIIFWNYVKHQRSDNLRIGTLKIGDKLLTSQTDKAEVLNNDFRSAFSPADPKIEKQKPSTSRNMPEIRVGAGDVFS